MKQRWICFTSLFSALLLLCSFLPALAASNSALGAAAPASMKLWASPTGSSPSETRPISAVQWWYSSDDGSYYLFLPAEADTGSLQIWLEGAVNYAVDGLSVCNGDVVALLQQGAHTVQFDGRGYPLTVMKSANIPAMYITTESGSMSYINAVKGNEEEGALRMVSATGKIIYNNTLTQIKGRGNATWNKPKKPYQIKLNKSTDLIGAGSNKTWILLANYSERSLIRNKITYDLAKSAGLPNTTQSIFVDLYCNNQYMGNYQLCEKVQINNNRIEINDLEGATEDCNVNAPSSYPRFGSNVAVIGSSKGYEIPSNPDDITGGYLLELEYKDRYEAEVSGFVTSRGQPVVIKEPECASREQVAYISQYFQEFEDALYAPDGINPTTRKSFDEYFDLTSLARKYIIEEFSKNIDANVTSQYFYKPSDKESAIGYCGPVWDYDNALGNMKGATTTTGIYAGAKKGYTYYFYQLYQQKSFLNAVRAEWNIHFVPLISMCIGDSAANSNTLLRPMSEYYQELSPSAAMNFKYWNILNTLTTSGNDTGRTYEENYTYLRTFMQGRAAYLTSVWKLADIHSLTPAASAAESQGFLNILDYTGAAGTYIVDSEAALQKAADLVSGGKPLKGVTLLQTADIVLTKGFTPGGSVTGSSLNSLDTVFKGTYNGQGYAIQNLNISAPTQNGVGIFAASYQAAFRDLHITDGTVLGNNRVAALTGYGDQCTFLRCSNGAAITSNGGTDGTAGLAGVAREGAVFTSCYNTGPVSAGTAAGGLVGWGQTNITLTNCYNAGTISSKDSAALARTGAVLNFAGNYYWDGCGSSDKNGAQSFSASALTDSSLTGQLNAGSNVWAQTALFPALREGARANLVRLTKEYTTDGRVLNTKVVYYPKGTPVTLMPDNQNFLEEIRLDGVPLTAEKATLETDHLLSIALSVDAQNIFDYSGNGSYYISTPEELEAFLSLSREQDLSGSWFYLINDVNAQNITQSGGNFGGHLNGKFSQINALSVPLFQSVTDSGDVRKCTIKNSDLTGEGAIALINNGKISYITTQNTVINGQNPGGIAGMNNGIIAACSADGNIIGQGNVGGVAGSNAGTIKNCYNSARLITAATAAGIAPADGGTIADCYNRGILTGSDEWAISQNSFTNCFQWDWAMGNTLNVTTCTSADLANNTILSALPSLYWKSGTASPALIAVSYELGDADGDDRVTLSDAVLLLRYLNDLIPADQLNLQAADVNGNGFSIGDAVRLMQYLSSCYDF